MSCSGPDGTQWSSALNTCVGGVNTSCDSVNQTTCYYAFLINGAGFFGGRFDSHDIFTLTVVGGLPDAQVGDQVLKIGHRDQSGKWLKEILCNPEQLQRYTDKTPANSLRLELYRPGTGSKLKIFFRG